jgi:short-subunit dehydrogenase
LLANCTGFASYMPFVGLPPDGADALIRRDVLALTRLTHAALPGMIRRSSGAIIV